MKHIIKKLLREGATRQEQVNLVKQAPLGTVYPEEYIYNYVQVLHDNYDDFSDGDLGDRIEEYEQYKLMEIPIDQIESNFNMNQDIADDYGQEFLKTNYYPPVVLNSDFEVIDGTHRIGGLMSIGAKTVKAWVGID